VGFRRLLLEGERSALTTSLPPPECLARLRRITAAASVGSTDQRRVFYGFPEDLYRQDLAERPLRGRISERGFRVGRRIRVQQRPLFLLSSYRMLFATWVDGKFATDGSATQVTVTTKVFRGVGCFWLVVSGMTLLFVSATIGHPSGWPALIFPAGFIGLGIIARLAASNDANFLLGVLKSTFEARIVPS